MSRRKMQDRNVRKLTRLGGTSLGVTLPAEELREMGWREHQKVIIKKVRGGFLVKDWKE